MANILVTGSNGQLGNELKSIACHFDEFKFHFHDIDSLDITSSDAVNKIVTDIKPFAIFNCAAYTAVDKAESDETNARKINATAVSYLTSAAKSIDCMLIHVSTDYVFDGSKNTPYNESDQIHPVSVYGTTKAEGEKFVLNYNKGIVIRTAWLYSSFGNNFVKTMLRLGKEREALNVVFDQVGTPTYALDLANCMMKIAYSVYYNPDNFIPGLYHFSNEGVCSWYDFSKFIMMLSNLPCRIYPIESKDYPTPASRPHFSVFCKEKIKKDYKIEIPYWIDSLNDCLNTIKNA